MTVSESEIEYDVYATPRIGAIEFGEYVALSSSRSKERLLTRVKYVKRAYRPRAWRAREAIVEYLTSATRNIGIIDHAIEECRELQASPDYGRSEDASVSYAYLRAFIGLGNALPLNRKTFEAPGDLPDVLTSNGLAIRLPLQAIIRSASRSGPDKIGTLFINTRAGQGPGTKEATIAQRRKAGETVSLLAYMQTVARLADDGEPHPGNCWNLFVRAETNWVAPTSTHRRIEDIHSDAAAIVRHWDEIRPPDDFDPRRSRSR